MTKEKLIEKLLEAEKLDSSHFIHEAQYEVMLEYINDKEVSEIYNRTEKFYS